MQEKTRALLECGAALLYPRHCPLCGTLLGPESTDAAVCKECEPEEKRLRHTSPRLPETEHCFYAVSGAACAYYYSGSVRSAVLACKDAGHPWYARELADLMAVRIFGAEAAKTPGCRPQAVEFAAFPRYNGIVPVPPRHPEPGVPSMPLLLAQRIGQILNIPVVTPLRPVRIMLPQKELNREERLQNTKDAYTCLPNYDFDGERILLVDDVITTGATVSACAKALLDAGAADVFAAGVAADEILPKEKQLPKKANTPNANK